MPDSHPNSQLTRAATGTLSRSNLLEAACNYVESSLAENTRRAYAGDWRRFDAWCREHGVASMPASSETVALYRVHLAESGRRPSTIGRARAALGQAHRLAGHDPSPTEDPRVRQVERGIRRSLGVAPEQALPLSPDELRRAFAVHRTEPLFARDRAMLVLGFAAALRRSELVALDVDDVEFATEGLVVSVCLSKTDQEARGERIAVPTGEHPETCPLRALRAWLDLLGRNVVGPLFREVRGGTITDRRASARCVSRAVKRAVQAAGLEVDGYSGHSLRAGLATTAARAGKSDRAIMRQGRWRSRATVDRYVREGKLWTDENAVGGVGL